MTESSLPDYGNFWPKLTRENVLREQKHRQHLEDAHKAPAQVEDLAVTATTATVNARAFNYLTVTWSVPDPTHYDHVRVLVKGYGTSNELGTYGDMVDTLPWVNMAEANDSPVNLYLEETAEEIVIGVQAYNSDGVGSSLATMPTTNITLT